ncbi:MAG: protein kinase [Verrucomicrobiae bacterium]|nr:protein kinase [Verrucomicrobiae bacterium]
MSSLSAATTGFSEVRLGLSQLPRDPLPRNFGRFILTRPLGAGAMGLVFAARQRKPEREVALKMIRFGPLATAEETLRFHTEVSAVARLTHPNIVPVFETGEVDGHPYFTMELLPGGSLAERIAGEPTGDASSRRGEVAARLIATVARAVHFAHQHGILHRDLKPSNILLDAHGEPHLCDFGLAKITTSVGTATLTRAGASLGTPDYMAPEQAAGRHEDLTVATDVWALGAILYELLTGKRPFTGNSIAATLERVQHEDPVSPERHSPGLDRNLAAICLKCLRKRPEQRYASAEALAGDLERWLRQEPVLARAATPWEHAAGWMRRQPRVTALIATVMLCLISGFAGISREWRRAEIARRLAEDNAYFGTVANALAARSNLDIGHARHLLASIPPDQRGFEWRLLNWLTRGDDLAAIHFTNAVPQSLSWWPQKERFVVFTDRSRLHLFDPVRGTILPKSLATLDGDDLEAPYPARHRRIRISPDGRQIHGTAGDTVLVTDVRSGELRVSWAGRSPTAAWLDDHRLLLGSSRPHGAPADPGTAILDLATLLAGPGPPLSAGPVGASPRRRWIATTHPAEDPWASAVHVWPAEDFPQGEPKLRLKGRPHRFLDAGQVQFSSDERYIAVIWGTEAIGLREITVHEIPTGQRVFFQHLRFSVNAVAFSPTDPLLAVASDDGVLRTFDFLEPAHPNVPDPNLNPDPDVSVAAAPASLLSLPSGLLVRSAQDGRAGFLLGHEARIRDVAFTPDGRMLVTVSDDGTLRMWPVRAAVSRQAVSGVETATFAFKAAASSNGRWILFRRPDQHGWWWDTAESRLVDLGDDEQPVAVLSDGRALTYAPEEARYRLWDCRGRLPETLWQIEDPGLNLRGRLGGTTPDGRHVLVLKYGELVRLDLESRSIRESCPIRVVDGNSSVADLAIEPSGKRFAVTSADPHVQIRPVSGLDPVERTLKGRRDQDTAVAFHPDGSRLFVGNEDGWVRVFETIHWAELSEEGFRAHRGAVTALAVSADGTVLATSGDQSLKLWSAGPPGAAPRRQRLQLPMEWARNWIRFADDDRRLIHSAEYQPLEVWEAPR